MNATEAKRLRELELENGKLKRLLAEVHLDVHALKKHFWHNALAPQVKRAAVRSDVATLRLTSGVMAVLNTAS